MSEVAAQVRPLAGGEKVRWTAADIALLPQNEFTRYEIIDGDLHMSRQPSWEHQNTCGRIYAELLIWSRSSKLGEPSINPGILFSDVDNVIPDVVWISFERLKALKDPAGHLTGAPELVVEVLSYGEQNEARDRQAKLKLYTVYGMQEYWIADWRLKQMEIYRRERDRLRLTATLFAQDELTSPLLPGFACPVGRLFE
ncbi:MAG: Uma2 family endonuclease [Anaerolineae bacterium]|nr:Uma2 family endonuclease [Candidatus Roseilinea sp.]MDW8450513.1 Uma2 family endonuclease [Anaerolineae bacterium]